MCSLPWQDLWLIIFALSQKKQGGTYHFPLRSFFQGAIEYCGPNTIFEYTAQVRVDFEVIGSGFEGDKHKHAFDLGLDIMNDFYLLVKEKSADSGLVSKVAFYPFRQDGQLGNAFSIKILLFDTTNMLQSLSYLRTYTRVNAMVDLFLHHFKNGKLSLDNAYFKIILKMRAAGKCFNFGCEFVTNRVNYPLSLSTTRPPGVFVGNGGSKPNRSSDNILTSSSSSRTVVTVLIFYMLLLFDTLSC